MAGRRGRHRDRQPVSAKPGLSIGVDLNRYGIPGGSIFLYGLTNNRAELSGDLIGDFQTVSNIDNGQVFRLFEA